MKMKRTTNAKMDAVPYLSTAAVKRRSDEPYNEGNAAHEASESGTDEKLEQSMANHPRFLRHPGQWAAGKKNAGAK